MLQVFSLTRVVMNVSQLAGPWVGGMLYELDGFYLPFLVMGIIQVRNIVNFSVLRIPDVYAGSLIRIFLSRIPDPGSKKFLLMDPYPHQSIKVFVPLVSLCSTCQREKV